MRHAWALAFAILMLAGHLDAAVAAEVPRPPAIERPAPAEDDPQAAVRAQAPPVCAAMEQPAAGELGQTQRCCCITYDGANCCNYVSFCTGRPPGCPCR